MEYLNKKLKKLKKMIRYVDGELVIEGIPAKEIAIELGTPVFIFSANRIVDNLKTFSSVFKKYLKNVEFFYPYRANYLPNLLYYIHKGNWGAETVSMFEYKLAKSVMAPKIILNGFNKVMYKKVIDDEKLFYISVDSLDDLLYLNNLGREKRKIIDVGIRLYPNLKSSKDDALYPSGFKLGYDIKNGDAEKIMERASKLPNIRVIALGSHIAIRQVTPQLHSEALNSLTDFADYVCTKYKINIEYINIGGGFETRSLLENSGSIENFAIEFKKILDSAEKEYKLILEPGRYIINDSSVVLTQIISHKINNNNNWLITDVGVNTLIPLKSASFEVIPFNPTDRDDIFHVGDYIASSIGIIKRDVRLPSQTSTGDYLCILYTGAYTLSMAEQFCLLKPTVALIEDGNLKIIKKKEDVESFIPKLMSNSW